MTKFTIAGIQQIGIGVSNVHKAFDWYNAVFGMDVPVFEEAAEAKLMLPYTGGLPHSRHAILALNLHGGGGFEIWQYTSRKPVASAQTMQIGDIGLQIARMKSPDPLELFQQLSKNPALKPHLSSLFKDPKGDYTFIVIDPFGNRFQVVKSMSWFQKAKLGRGGALGVSIGVRDIEKSKAFYKTILGFDTVVYDETGVFADLQAAFPGQDKVRRVLLRHSKARSGSFSNLLGCGEIELIQALEREPNVIFEGRYWGDLGFIHLCFDIVGMSELKQHCESNGSPFTVDSANSFDMGEAAGHFVYIEDPDGTLIEFVETHKVPILKQIGWYIHLKAGAAFKPVPKWLIRAMAIKRTKRSLPKI